MEKSERLWAVLFGVLVVSAYAIPYLFLQKIYALYGTALFWTAFALTVILLLIRFTRGWQDHEKE